MFLWYPVLDLARAPRRTARKKGSGYENASTVIDQKTRSVHIYGHLNTYILLFDYRTLLVYTLQLTFKVGVSSVFECYWLMAYNGKANC